jgi:hypothetical protein
LKIDSKEPEKFCRQAIMAARQSVTPHPHSRWSAEVVPSAGDLPGIEDPAEISLLGRGVAAGSDLSETRMDFDLFVQVRIVRWLDYRLIKDEGVTMILSTLRRQRNEVAEGLTRRTMIHISRAAFTPKI